MVFGKKVWKMHNARLGRGEARGLLKEFWGYGFFGGLGGPPPENFWIWWLHVLHSSVFLGHFTPMPTPQPPRKKFSSDLHWSQEWSWELGKSLKSDFSLKILSPATVKSQAEASRDSAMRGVPLYTYYVQFGQYTHLMGSGRPPWAAGELTIPSRWV